MTRFLITAAGCAVLLSSQSVREIIDRIDDNRVFESIEYTATMKISLSGRVREKDFTGVGRSDSLSYVEFTAPERDRGTRFLKLKNEMYIYLPDVGKATRIAGHMLRQSMMGSDFSYDDFTENTRLADDYDLQLAGSDTLSGFDCYVIELAARVEEIAYARRRMWVTKDAYLPVKTELYARSGKLLKEFSVLETRRIGRRDFPVRLRMTNKLRRDTYTELYFKEIALDRKVPDRLFTLGYLERK